ncbi:MAG: hypothetical protein LC624_06240 [Halobacteriales archaeon]|nr:hypothetical protein [Halobacteriales archaeon]
MTVAVAVRRQDTAVPRLVVVEVEGREGWYREAMPDGDGELLAEVRAAVEGDPERMLRDLAAVAILRFERLFFWEGLHDRPDGRVTQAFNAALQAIIALPQHEGVCPTCRRSETR